MRRRIATTVVLLAVACSHNRSARWDDVVERTHLGVTCPSAVKHHTLNGSLLIDQYFGEQCERIGLAVWLRKPAGRLEAWLAGRRVDMRAAPPSSPEFATPSPGPSTYFVGFRRPAGFRDGKLHVGRNTRVRLIADGVETSTSIWCCGGWG